MTLDLEAMKRRCAAATKGMWIHANTRDWASHIVCTEEEDIATASEITSEGPVGLRAVNAEFIAHAKQDIPALINEIERLNNVFDQFEKLIRNIKSDLERRLMHHE